MTYTINRPPVVATFELPTRDQLLTLTPGDFVKVIFADDEGIPAERMWVKLTDTSDSWEWVGSLDNDPSTLTGITYGDLVRFHPLDVINWLYKDETE